MRSATAIYPGRSTRPSRSVVLAISLMLAATSSLRAADWPRFRGPDGCGITDERNLPTQWDAVTGKNVLWKAELPKSDMVLSSPIVVGDKVVLTYAIGGAAPEHHVICFGRADGKKLWDAAVEPGPLKKVDPRAGFAAPTPCSDGTHIFAAFASAVIASLDMDGKIVWRNELPNTTFDVVMGNSPILYGDTVILINDLNNRKSQFLAWDKTDGKVKLDVPRPGCNYAHSTPILARIGGKDQLIAAASSALQGIDPATGAILWQASTACETASPAFDGGLIYIDNGRGAAGVAIAPGGQGDITAQALKTKFKNTSDLGSALVLGDYVYRQAGDKLTCLSLSTGETIYTKPVPGASSWASPLATRDGVIYVGTSGICHIFKAGPAGEEIGTNNLGDDSPASAAASDGNIIFRGTKFLWCIGNKPH